MKHSELNLEIACLIEEKIRKLEGEIVQLREKRDEFHKIYEDLEKNGE